MTPETREELARAIAPNARDWSARYRDARKTADAIAPLIERMVAERVAALNAERDASVAALQTQARRSRALGITEGERRATAAIVADLKRMFVRRKYSTLAARYERGEHITEAKP